MSTEGESQYLQFVREERKGRKTPIVHIRSKSSGLQLGEIRWHGAWRQFCFYPEVATIFNVDCMTDIQNQIAALMAERRLEFRRDTRRKVG